MNVKSRLDELLGEFLADSDCPGAVLGVVVDDETTVSAAGVLNLNTGVETTPDSVFQIGSVTKVWTATVILQLVDEGKVDLDAPVRAYLPTFALSDDVVAKGVTVRHLLSHTSGIEGDVFDDVGTNDDCLSRYVDALAGQGSIHDLGETWSYCNSGYVLLGRIIEEVTGGIWDAAVKERLGAPLAMEHLCTTAGEAILHRASVGHMRPPGPDGKREGDVAVAPIWSLPRSLGPAGLVSCSAGDLLAFARMHLSDGRGPDGTQVLSPESVKRMQEPQAECPEPMLADHYGLGWALNDWDGRRVVGHGGNTIGQSAYFLTVPDRRVAVTLLTNLTGGAKQAQHVMRTLLRELADVTMPPAPEPVDSIDVDPSLLVGTYRRHGVRMEVASVDGALQLTMQGEGAIAEAMGLTEPIVTPLRPFERTDAYIRFVTRQTDKDDWSRVTFYAPDADGRPRFVHSGARVARRED